MLHEGEKFLQYLTSEKRSSSNTIVSAQTDLKQFSDFLEKEFEITSVQEVTSEVVRTWLMHLSDSGLAPTSINRKLSTLRSLYRFLQKNKLVEHSPLTKTSSLKTGKKLPQFIPLEQIDKIKPASTSSEFLDLTHDLVVKFFYYTGLRLTELINIRLGDVDIFNCMVKVLGKRNKERMVPLHHDLLVSVKDYIAKRNEIGAKCENLFIDHKGMALHPKSVYRAVQLALSGIKVLNKKSPHVLRHTFATHMLNAGAELNGIKEVLGHASLASTQVYTHNSIEKLKQVYKKAHPKA